MKKTVRVLSLLLCIIMCISSMPVPAMATEDTGVSVAANGAKTIYAKEGQKVTMKVKARGSKLKYQWYYRKNAKASWKKYSGKTKSTLSFKAGRVNGYQYRCKVYNSAGTKYSQVYKLKVDYIQYRALLITQRYDDTPEYQMRPYDAINMQRLLECKTPSGVCYSVNSETSLSGTGIENAIETAFSGADSNDVSLLYFSGMGDASSAGANAGRLRTIENGGYGYLSLSTLASWLNKVPGKVIVVLAASGSGAAVYGSNVSSGNTGSDAQRFNRAAISAFAAADTTIPDQAGLAANTGELCTSKFIVLTAAGYQETARYETETVTGSSRVSYYDVFTSTLYDSIYLHSKAMDINKNKLLSLGEIYTYVSARLPAGQHMQVYPSADSTYALFQANDVWHLGSSRSNPEIAAVAEDGTASAAGAGKATITVTTADGGFVATCVVTVRPAEGAGKYGRDYGA